MTFFEKLSIWAAFLGGAAALLTAIAGLYTGKQAINQLSENAVDTVPDSSLVVSSATDQDLESQVAANTVLINANLRAAEIILSAERFAKTNAEIKKDDAMEFKAEMEKLADENQAALRKIGTKETDETSSTTIGPFEGWIYIGKYENGLVNNNTIEDFDNKLPSVGDTAVLDTDVHLRSDKPRFPLYRMAALVEPKVLKAGTSIKINEIYHQVGVRNFSWAKVSQVK